MPEDNRGQRTYRNNISAIHTATDKQGHQGLGLNDAVSNVPQDPHKVSGPDNIQGRLLIEAAEELAPGLTFLFQISLDSRKIPTDWKSALVTPVFKKGNRSSPANYRPISLTSIVCKILQHVVHSSVINHFERNNIPTDSQHGFRKRRLCETQLLLTIDNLAKGLDDRQQIDAMLLDFSKALTRCPINAFSSS